MTFGLSAATIAGLAISAGGAAYSASQAHSAANAAKGAANQQMDIARQLFGEAEPLRQPAFAELANFFNTGVLPAGLNVGLDRITTAGRQGLEGQYNAARRNILENTPTQGGQLNSLLAANEMQRAGSIGRLGADVLGQYELPLRQQLFTQGLNAAIGAPTQALAGLGGAAGNLTNLAGMFGQQATGSGQAAGSMLALALKKQQQNNPSAYGSFANPGAVVPNPYLSTGTGLYGDTYT